MMDVNAGRRIRIMGDEHGWKVYTVEPDGEIRELPCRSVTVTLWMGRDGQQQAEGMVYFTSPELQIETPRSSDGVRAG